MNSKTARLIRRFAKATATPLKHCKAVWNSTARNKRAESRKQMKAFVEETS